MIEASSGSTAVSEAYFARMLGLRFIAVVPASTAPPKLDAIRFYGGEIHEVADPRAVYDVAQRLAARDAAAIISTSSPMPSAPPTGAATTISPKACSRRCAARSIRSRAWVVCGAGTGGTSATIGRFIRYQRFATALCVADPGASRLPPAFRRSAPSAAVASGVRSQIEGIGRPRVEPSFMPDIIDRMIAVPDSDSIGAMRALSTALGRRVGGSTGTNLIACAALIEEMAARGEEGSIVTLLCDDGERYACTYYDDDWLARKRARLAARRGADREAARLNLLPSRGTSGSLARLNCRRA